jgi:carbamate kinase
MTILQAERYLIEGHFLAGSMGPKVEASIRFLKKGGKRAIITSLDGALDGLNGKTGTHIIPSE